MGLIALLFALWEGWEIYHSLHYWQPGNPAESSLNQPAVIPATALPDESRASLPGTVSRERSSRSGEAPDAAVRIRELTLPDLQQHPQSLHQWAGRVLVINFWATWCEPCKEEIPMMNHLQRNLGDQQVRFVGIGVDEPGAILDFVKHQPFSYPVLTGSDQDLALTRSLGNPQQGIPFTLVFDAKGHTILKKLGRMEESELRQAITAAKAGG